MPPMLIAAGIGAAASIGGAALSSSSARKSANQANATSQANTNANNALARDIYGQNQAILSPFVNRGNEAGTAINALLGLGGGQPPIIAQPPLQGPAQQPYGYASGTLNALGIAPGGEMLRGDFMQPGLERGQPQMFNGQFGQPEPVYDGMPAAIPGAVTTPPPQMGSTTPYGDAFNNFLNSTGFKFQMDQGNKATNQGYAARGMLQSGAALKALQDRGQQTALNNYFLPYMNLLGQQQGVGLSGASAVAGVGQNYAGTVTANNNMGTQTALDVLAAKNAANQQLYGSIGGALGNLAGAAFGSSYQKKQF